MEDMAYIPYDIATGSLMYAMVYTRIYIAQALGVLSQFMVNPKHEHWAAIKRVFKYVQGTYEYSIFYHNDVSWVPHLVEI